MLTKTRTVFSVFLVVFGMLFFLKGNVISQEPADTEAVFDKDWVDTTNYDDLNADIESLTEAISTLCSEPGFRGFLRSEMSKSKNSEQILELDKFLDRATKNLKKDKSAPGLQKAKSAAGKARGSAQDSTLLALKGFDLYIPVVAHRTKWKGGKDFVVAASPMGDDLSIKKIVGFSVKDGSKVELDSATPPEMVVLVVAPCEHEDHTITSEEPVDPPDDGAPHEDNPTPGEGEKDKDNSFFYMSYIKIHDDHEPWYRGDPEVYLLVGQIRNGEDRGYKFNLARVNKTGRWYWIRDLTKMYFDGNSSYDTYYGVWESDGAGSGCYMYTNRGRRIYPYIKSYPTSGGTQPVWCLYVGNSDDEIHGYPPRCKTNKMLGAWNTHNYDSNYSDTRTAQAKFYKVH